MVKNKVKDKREQTQEEIDAQEEVPPQEERVEEVENKEGNSESMLDTQSYITSEQVNFT